MKAEEKKELQNCIRYLMGEAEIKYDPYPLYSEEVMKCLSFLPTDADYFAHSEAYREGRKPLSRLSRAELGAMFTFILRGERFCDGHINYLDYYNNRRIKLKLKGLTPAQHRFQTLQVA